MSRLAIDRQVIQAARFRRVVELWLDKLPPGGWEGSSRELADALDELSVRRRVYASIPLTIGPVLADMEPILSERGFRVSLHRTKHARTVRVERVKRGKTAAG